MLFRKIVSNLPFSPALAGQLGFYVGRLKKEQATRRLGLLFTALAVVVQSFAIFNPPQPALATNPNCIISGGVYSKDALMNAWDKNLDGHGNRDFQQLLRHFLGQDFSRADLAAANHTEFGSRDKVNGARILVLGRSSQASDPDQKAYYVNDANGDRKTVYSHYIDSYDKGANTNGRGTMYPAFVGNFKGKWFAITKDCGNIAFSEDLDVPSLTPKLHVVANCRSITGYAYENGNLNAYLKVYLYMGGGPGTGEQFTTTASLGYQADKTAGDHGYEFTVPAKYHTGNKEAYTVVVMPSAANGKSVQYSGAVDTASCKPAEPVASCDAVKLVRQNGKPSDIAFQAKTSLANGATITGYRIELYDNSNKVVQSKTFTTDAADFTTETFSVANAGEYRAKVTALTSVGEKSSPACEIPFVIAPPEKCALNPAILASDPTCKPCPDNPTVWEKDPECAPEIVQTKTVSNLTQELTNASGTTARAGDRLLYTLYTENTGLLSTKVDLTEDLSDVLEYANLTDFDDGKSAQINAETGVLTWPSVTLAPGQKVVKTLTVQVKEVIPSTPQSVANPTSYDCKMGNVFGGASVVTNVQCPPAKTVEVAVSSLPKTGAGANIAFSTVLVVLSVYLYARVRQMNKELKIMRRNFNTGVM